MPINAQILDNPKSDRVRRIADLTRAKGRERSGRFLIEGPQSVREAVTWRPDVVQDLYVEVSQALEHPRIISSTLEKIVETSQDATIYVHYCTGDVMHRISPDAQGIAAVGNAESMHAGADDVELGKNGRAPQIAAFWQVRRLRGRAEPQGHPLHRRLPVPSAGTRHEHRRILHLDGRP